MDYFYLDIGPMIRKLQQNPSEFEIRENRIRHRWSRHRLTFERDGKGQIVARCNRVDFSVNREQGVALRVAIGNWEDLYPRSAIPRDPVGRLTKWVNSALSRYFWPGNRWWQTIHTVLARVAAITVQRPRPVRRHHLRIVSSRTGDTGLAGDPPGGTPPERSQKVAAFREVTANGRATSPAKSSCQKRRL
jgi:hypothetical protein